MTGWDPKEGQEKLQEAGEKKAGSIVPKVVEQHFPFLKYSSKPVTTNQKGRNQGEWGIGNGSFISP